MLDPKLLAMLAQQNTAQTSNPQKGIWAGASQRPLANVALPKGIATPQVGMGQGSGGGGMDNMMKMMEMFGGK